jgi:LmbE family N-acetylglucosaminyl deacetylase
VKKIVIFAPHPDDELIGAGGALLKWKDEGHEIHIIYLSDGRAAYTYERAKKNLVETEATKISEKELAQTRMQEVERVAEFLEFPPKNLHKFKIPDQKVKDFKEMGIKKSKKIIKDAERIVIPSNNNLHVDHQATFDIAVNAALELNLQSIEFYIYAIYLSIEAPPSHKVKVNIKKHNEKIYNALQLYESQKYIKTVNAVFERKKREIWERFGVFKLQDLGNFKNF